MSTAKKLNNAEEALVELMMFFIRHSLPAWPAKLSAILELLREQKLYEALDEWGRFPLMGEYGLMQVEVSYEYGYRAQNYHQEQAHFQQLLEQFLATMNNLRSYVRSGVDMPLLEIYRDQ